MLLFARGLIIIEEVAVCRQTSQVESVVLQTLLERRRIFEDLHRIGGTTIGEADTVKVVCPRPGSAFLQGPGVVRACSGEESDVQTDLRLV